MTRRIDPRGCAGFAIALLLACASLGGDREARAAEAQPAAPVATAPDAKDTGASEPPAPSRLPDDLPLYAQAVAVSSMNSPSGGTIVNLRSGDAPDPIFAWYCDELPKRGWTVEKQNVAGGQHLVAAFKEGRKLTVVISRGHDTNGEANAAETRILLTVVRAE